MKIKDYQDRIVELSEISWGHIQESHPEISLEDVRSVLTDPLEVRESRHQSFVELFYQMKDGRTLYRKGETK